MNERIVTIEEADNGFIVNVTHKKLADRSKNATYIARNREDLMTRLAAVFPSKGEG